MKKRYTKLIVGVIALATLAVTGIQIIQDLNAATTGIAPRVVRVDKFADLQETLVRENADSIFIVNYGVTSGDGLGGMFVYSNSSTNTADARDVHLSYTGVGRLLRIDQGHPLQVGPDAADPAEYTIATGAIVPVGSFFVVDTESDGATDDLATITATNYKPGDIIFVQAENTARTVVLKDGTGNLRLAADFSLDNTEDVAQLMLVGTNWVQVAVNNNGS